MAQSAPPVLRGLKSGSPGEKLLVPNCFERTALLNWLHHEHRSTNQLKSFVDKSLQNEWATPNTAYALLSNAEMFWVDIEDDVRFHGGCAVVKTQTFAKDIKHPAGYSEDITVAVTERTMKKVNNKVEPDKEEDDTVVLDRFDTYGGVWFHRRYQIPQEQGEPTYCFVQWMDARVARLKEKPSAIKLSDISMRIDSLEESQKRTCKEIAEIKDIIKDFTAVVRANLAQAESIREFVKDQTTASTKMALELNKLREELRLARTG